VASATATVLATGGNLGSAKLTVDLVDQDGWKLDSIQAIELDRGQFLEAQRRQTEDGEIDSWRLSNCWFHYADTSVKTSELETAVMEGNDDYLSGSFDQCAAQFRAFALSPATVKGGSNFRVTSSQARCISRHERGWTTTHLLRLLYQAVAAHRPPPPLVLTVQNAAVSLCLHPARAARAVS
jgi:hypothetical protein